jgi:hypothetical protein
LQHRAHELSLAISTLESRANETTTGADRSGSLERRLGLLLRLSQGFEQIVSRQPEERDLAAAFRPVRSMAQDLDGQINRGNIPEAFRSTWKAVQVQVDDLAGRFQLPREIVIRPSQNASPPNQTINPQADAVVRALDSSLDLLNSKAAGRDADPLAGVEAQKLQTRLLVLRQQLLGGEPNSRLGQSLGALELARSQWNDRLRQPAGGQTDRAGELARDLDRVIAQVRERISKGP